MAIDPSLTFIGQITAPTPSYPYGAARNVSSQVATDGTPLNAAWVNDLFGLIQAALTNANIVPNNTSDTALNSQILQAIQTIQATGSSELRTLQDRGADYVVIEDFGAVGDGVTDDSQALIDAVDTGKKIHLTFGKIYNFATIPSFVDKDVMIEGNGATILLGGNNNALLATANITDVYGVTSIDNAGLVDLSGGTTATNSEVVKLTILTTAAYEVGDYIKIVSDDLMLGEDTGEQRKNGEFLIVAEKTATVLTCYSRLKATYTTNPRVGRVNPNGYKFSVKNLKIKGQLSPDPTWSLSAIDFRGFINAEVENIEGNDLVERLIRELSCYGTVAKNIFGKNIRTDIPNNAFGYVWNAQGCEGGQYSFLKGINTRHVWTGSAPETADLGDVLNYGQNRNAVISNSNGKNGQAGDFDTHADCENITFIGCVSDSSYSGPYGNLNGFQLRGRNNKVDSCVAIGNNGFRAGNDFASPDNSRDHEFNNCTYYHHPNQSTDKRAFSAVGMNGAVVKGITINNPVIYHVGDNPIFECFFGEMEVNNITIKSKYTGTNTARFFEVNDDSSKIVASGGKIDLTGSTGTGLRLARYVGGNGDADSTSGTIDIRDIKITADSKLEYLADLRSKNGTFIAKDINTTNAPTGAVDGLVNAGIGTCYVDWVENDGRTDTLAHFGGGSLNGNTVTLNFGKRDADHLYARTLVSVADGVIDNIEAGKKLGQKLTIYLRTSSTANLIIDGDGTNIDIGTDQLILPGKAITLMWANSNTANNNWVLVGVSNSIESNPAGVVGADQVKNVMSLTQLEYDAIVSPDPSTFYIIT